MGMHKASDIEAIHTLRRVLGVRKSTHLSALYGETGRVPLDVFRKFIMIKYWSKLITQNYTLLKNVCKVLKDDADSNRNYGGNNWAFQIKTILQQHGFNFVWNNQFDINIPLAAI